MKKTNKVPKPKDMKLNYFLYRTKSGTTLVTLEPGEDQRQYLMDLGFNPDDPEQVKYTIPKPVEPISGNVFKGRELLFKRLQKTFINPPLKRSWAN